MTISTSDRGRVLIVDDDRKILDLLVDLLELEGYEVCNRARRRGSYRARRLALIRTWLSATW